jgi:hypothetical protein
MDPSKVDAIPLCSYLSTMLNPLKLNGNYIYQLH